MKIWHTKDEALAHNIDRLGFVPTMGNLHSGHISLVKKALEENEHVCISIFVNPTQFAPGEDFEKYPRTLKEDIEKLDTLDSKRIIIFAPKTPKEIYNENFSFEIKAHKKYTQQLCGRSRPTHFDGVTLVVYLLFKIIRPQKAYFGLKDYQQYFILKKMSEDLVLNVSLIGLPIVRDFDGLALSSRNQFLTTEDRKKALILPNTLEQIKTYIKNNQYDNVKSLIQRSKNSDSNWDYLEVRNSHTLDEDWMSSSNILIAGAYKLNDTRIIDNLLLGDIL